jgi:hypothetical protein
MITPDSTLTALDVVFPAGVHHLMPSMESIPEEFHSRSSWNKLISEWFFRGLNNISVVPAEGIDENNALRHVKCIMGSFEPKHEHKEAACAYLMSQWFKSVKWVSKDGTEHEIGGGK